MILGPCEAESKRIPRHMGFTVSSNQLPAGRRVLASDGNPHPLPKPDKIFADFWQRHSRRDLLTPRQ